MKLYHGTTSSSKDNILKNGIDVKYSHKVGDFGIGFYLTPDLFNAKNIALRKVEVSEMKPSIIEVTTKTFDKKLKVKDFTKANILNDDKELMKWAQFIINNRCGKKYIKNVSSKYGFEDNSIDNRYDIIIGKTADGQITKIFQLCEKEQRLITLEEAKNLLSKDYGIQYCIKTKNGLKVFKENPKEKKGVSWR